MAGQDTDLAPAEREDAATPSRARNGAGPAAHHGVIDTGRSSSNVDVVALCRESDDLLTTDRGITLAAGTRQVREPAVAAAESSAAPGSPLVLDTAPGEARGDTLYGGIELSATAAILEEVAPTDESEHAGSGNGVVTDTAMELADGGGHGNNGSLSLPMRGAASPTTAEPAFEQLAEANGALSPEPAVAESAPSESETAQTPDVSDHVAGPPSTLAGTPLDESTAAQASEVPGIAVPFALASEDAVATRPIETITEPPTATLTVTEPLIPVVPPPMEPPSPPLGAEPPPPPAAPPPDGEEEEGATMTIIEHLEELRRRMTISAIAVVVSAVGGWFLVAPVLKYLQGYVTDFSHDAKFISLSVLGPLALQIKLAFVFGLIIGSPVVLYQIWSFVAPGLTRRERRYALPFSLLGSFLFAAGATAGIVVVPLALRFLLAFFPTLHLDKILDINGYVMFIVLIAVIFGVTFELPIFMVGLSLTRLVNSRFFIQKFKIAIFVIYGAAMVITPGVDFISPLILGTVLVGLYWVGVLLIRFTGR